MQAKVTITYLTEIDVEEDEDVEVVLDNEKDTITDNVKEMDDLATALTVTVEEQKA